MPRDSKTKQQLRSRIAAAAARIIAEDGLEDFALAKRKAARQLGAEATRALPDNAEVEEALRTYQALYQEEEQRERVRILRGQALQAMQFFSEFRPYLRGSVLRGTAGRYGDIDLQLFTDDSKAVELFLLNHNMRYEVGEWRRRGLEERGVQILKLEWEGVPLTLAVYPMNDERITPAATRGTLSERASIPALRLLIAQDPPLASKP